MKNSTKRHRKGPKAKCRRCGTVIQSKNVHDLAWCKCGAIGIDGGAAYIRCIGTPGDFLWENEETGEFV